MAGLAAAVGLSWLLTAAIRRYALRSDLLDVPNERSLHRTPTPRGGGAAIAVVTLAGIAVAAFIGLIAPQAASLLLGGGALVSAVGWIDDRSGVRASVRAAVHACAAAWAIYWIWGTLSLTALVGGVVIIWAINLYNFMDGIDGLAGAEAVCVGAGGGALLLGAGRADLAAPALILAAAAGGFLIWNWPPARIFMGDVGSGFLGYCFGALSLLSARSDAVPLDLWLLMAGVFVFDATITLIRRVVRGERWYEAHRTHAYQRLVQGGRTHAVVTTGIVAVNLVLAALAAMAASGALSRPAAVLAGIVVLTVLYLAIERRRPMFSGASGPRLP